MSDRRSAYFCFQGLLAAVLLLLFSYQEGHAGWSVQFWLLAAALLTSLLYIRLASAAVLFNRHTTSTLFFIDAVLASLALRWARPGSDLYLIYLAIIFGTALVRNLTQTVTVAFFTSILYLVSVWTPQHWFPSGAEFWLKFLFLWISTLILAVLAQDSQNAQEEENRLSERRVMQAEHLANLGEIAGEVAHRIKGPLTTIMVNAELLARDPGISSKGQTDLKEIATEAALCKDILRNLLDLGRIEEIHLLSLDLRKPIEKAWQRAQRSAKQLGIAWEIDDLPKPLWVRGDESLLQEAFFAVLQNAAEATPVSGRVRLSVKDSPRALAWTKTSPKRWTVVIEDNGRGMDRTTLEKIFRPFFTTKAPSGHGLGLSSASRIMQKHGGSIAAASPGPGFGSRFTLSIPKVAPKKYRA